MCLRDERCLVGSIDADKKRTGKGKTWIACLQNVDWETHHGTSSLHAQASLSGNHPIHPNNVRFVARASRRHHLRDAVQAVVAMKARRGIAHRYIHTVHLHRDTEQGGGT